MFAWRQGSETPTLWEVFTVKGCRRRNDPRSPIPKHQTIHMFLPCALTRWSGPATIYRKRPMDIIPEKGQKVSDLLGFSSEKYQRICKEETINKRNHQYYMHWNHILFVYVFWTWTMSKNTVIPTTLTKSLCLIISHTFLRYTVCLPVAFFSSDLSPSNHLGQRHVCVLQNRMCLMHEPPQNLCSNSDNFTYSMPIIEHANSFVPAKLGVRWYITTYVLSSNWSQCSSSDGECDAVGITLFSVAIHEYWVKLWSLH